MGFLKNLFGNSENQFIDLVRAHENGEEWATAEIQKMWESNDSTLLPRIFRAYVVIYKDAAMRGDRDAIIKYARGLEWSDREEEALQWYMKLINQGDTDAMLELASDYTEYGGMGENDEERFRLIKNAAEMGNAEAQYKLAMKCGCVGDFLGENYWAQKSAEKGCPDGKLEYARVLGQELSELIGYKKNMTQFTDSAIMEYVLKKYEIESPDDATEIISQLYFKAEQLNIEYLNEGESETGFSEAMKNLAYMYWHPTPPAFSPMPYLAAYYFYRDYYYFDSQPSYKNFERVVTEFDLPITGETLQEWQETDIFTWAETHGIEVV